MDTRALVLCGIVTTSLLVCTPAALASPRSDHDSRHRTLTSWADHRGNDRERPTDHVWDRYNSRDDESDSWDEDDDSDSSDDAGDEQDGDTTSGTTSDTVVADTGVGAVAGGTGAVVGGSGKILSGTTQTIQIAQTGYSFADNTPNNSNEICCAIVHERAGGSGTFADPVTVAAAGSGSAREFAPGTRFYLPSIRKYGLIEDSGGTPMGKKHLDVYVNGQGLPKSASDSCMEKITGDRTAIIHPGPGLAVTPGPITTASGCNL